jgi:phosphoenolpyruvate---glycerone phosphotransferase subunit DhaL
MATPSEMAFLSDPDVRRRLIVAAADSVIANADALTALDSAIGDGDHGHNMRRGFEAALASADALAEMNPPELLRALGMKLVSTVGGASGPLYGTLFMALGKALPETPTRSDLAAAFEQAIAAVKARGKSEIGQKTMLDVLAPTLKALQEGADAAEIADIANRAAEATAPLRAIRGRASFLGERSVGHVDPGARSSALIIAALVEEGSKYR